MGTKGIISIAVLGLVGLVAVSSFFGAFYTIDQGERGIILTNGAISTTVGPGLGYKLPFVQSVVKISTRQYKIAWNCTNEGCRDGASRYAIEAYSRDQQPADIKLSVTYHVPESEVSKVYSIYGSVGGLEDRVVVPKTLQAVKSVFGTYNAETSIQGGAKLNADVSNAVAKSIDGPVIVDSVQVEDVAFSAAYEQAIENRMTAQVEVQKREQQLAQEKINAEIAVTQAQGRADSVKAEADAAAYKITKQGEAEANAIKARAAALSANAALIELTKAERWNGTLPTTVLPGNTVPFLDVAPAN